jgi:hypothetical protein
MSLFHPRVKKCGEGVEDKLSVVWLVWHEMDDSQSATRLQAQEAAARINFNLVRNCREVDI